jgi:Fe-S oxidoreductase
LIRSAKKLANANIRKLKDMITDTTPLIGIEPSAILTFRDEYPELVDAELKDAAFVLAKRCFMFDEFICQILDAGSGIGHLFTSKPSTIKLHGHCYQKALASVASTIKMLSIPENYKVEEIRSGCCGMAGSFGYEKEHYGVSMKVGELVLFPEVRKASSDVIIAAPGTSCRHQIFDGTGRKVLHPIEVLFEALLEQ